MIIDLVKNDNIYEKDSTINSNDKKEINLNEIKTYLINEKLNIIKSENIELLTEEIKKYLYEKYYVKDEKTIIEVIDKIINKMFGYDILQKFIEDINVSDIRCIDYNHIYIKQKGKWIKIKESFNNEEEFLEYVRYVVLKNGSNINYDIPIVVLSDKKYNLRIEAGISPVNIKSANLVIRIHRINNNISLETLYLKDNMLNLSIYKFLNNIIRNNSNIVISGKGGSGKTTLLKSLIEKIPEEISITSNEETAELFLKNRNIIQREIVTGRGKYDVDLEKLMKQSLVMSNDMIIVGELKGAEALMFFESISTGHRGFATVHSNSASATLDRLITLVKRDTRASTYTEEFISRMLADGIDYIIHMKDYKINEIMQIQYDYDKNKIISKIIYKFKYINEFNLNNIPVYKEEIDE